MEFSSANSDDCRHLLAAETVVRSAKAAATKSNGAKVGVRASSSSTALPLKKKWAEGQDSSDLGSSKLRSSSSVSASASSSKQSVNTPSFLKGGGVVTTTTTATTSSARTVPKRRNSTGSLVVVGKESSSPVADASSSSSTTTTTTKGTSCGAKVLPPVITHGIIGSRRTSLPSTGASATVEKKLPSRTKAKGGASLQKATSAKHSAPPGSAASTKLPPSRPSPSSFSSSRGNSSKRATMNVSLSSLSSAQRSPLVKGSLKSGSSLSSSAEKGLPAGRKKVCTPESQDSLLIMLPQIEVKAADDPRMDLRGHRVRSLIAKGLNLSASLEFLYLRDNLLSSLEGIEILKRVKVLDLSFNEFKGPGFEPLGYCKALQQLYLAGNQITSLVSLPELPNLEFLSVAQNRLKSLCMASQPRLQVLAASKNKISTLKGFPHFPVLEHLRVEENPVLETPHLEAAALLLVGPTLKKFNDSDLSPDEVELAKHYPAHTALCIRDGWEFCHPELAAESTFLFLAERWQDHFPPGYVLKEAFVDHPFEEDMCHCHFVFSSDPLLNNVSKLKLRYQWFIGENTPVNFAPIDDAVGEVYWPKREDVGKFFKIECTPVLEGIEYPPVFAVSSPVSAGTGCPRILSVDVHGEPKEGNVIRGQADVAWCGGTPGKGVASWLRRKWNSSPVVIAGAEDEEYHLTVDDIGSSLVFMYTPVTQEGAKGDPQYAMTDFVKAAAPSVTEVQIVGEVVEGNTIKGIGKYFGGKEGLSKFEWLRESEGTGDQLLASVGTNEYTMTKEDVGWRMAFCYIPVNLEGQEGTPVSSVTDAVRKAPPRVSNLKIVGNLTEGSKVTVTSVVTGGTEGSSRVQWFKTSSRVFEDDNGLEAVSTSKIAKAFRIPLGAVGYYLVAKFTPTAPDGDSGEPAYIISEKVVEKLPPSLNFLSVTGDYCEGELLTASYGYIGGHEGKSLYNWYLHESKTDSGVLVSEAAGSLQYRISKDAFDKFISFKCTPIRDDGTVGEPRLYIGPECVRPGSPKLLSLCILGEGVEGTTVSADKKYWGGDEGSSIFQWILTGDDGVPTKIKGATSLSYTLTHEDIGSKVSVSCEPVRSDGAHGPVIIAEQLGPILPGLPVCESVQFLGLMIEGEHLGFNAEYIGGEKGSCTHEWYRVKSSGLKEKLSCSEVLDLTILDVGECIELVYTPARRDGMKGPPKSIISSVIAPADPKGIELTLPDCFEDQVVIPKRSYYGGMEGVGKFIWYRTKKKLDVPNLLNLSESSDYAIVVGKSLTYTPTLKDVDAYLALFWVPTRDDGKTGSPVVASSSSPVLPAPPVVSDVCIKEILPALYAGEGRYYGGYEGSSLFSWYREHDDGSVVLIDGDNSLTYKVTDLDYNCRLSFGYTPVRSDSVVGKCKVSEPTAVILPAPLEIKMLSFMGKAVEGETLTAIEVIPDDEIQQRVWKKYKQEIRYQWFCSTVEDKESFEPLTSQCSSSYKLRLEDVGCCLKCKCFVIDLFGRSSVTTSAVTVPILPGTPKISKLEIEGRGFHTNLYAVRGSYSGGREGKSRIQWLRSMVGSPDLISIPGETGRMYEANVDDVVYRLVAIYTPVRGDGAEGESVSASTEPIAVEPDVYREVKQKVELGSVKFEVLCDRDQFQKKVPGVGNLERRILEVNRKRVKLVKPGSKASFPTTEIRGTYAPPFRVELYRNDQHRFKIVVDSEEEVDLMVQTRHMRDIIVLVIRGLAQRFNSTSLNSLLKIEM